MNEDRQMFQGNWTCAGCGAAITELPFEPRSTDNLMCRDCHKARKPKGNFQRRERQMFEGNWTCSECGGAINQLPFEPRDTSNLKCRECFRK